MNAVSEKDSQLGGGIEAEKSVERGRTKQDILE